MKVQTITSSSICISWKGPKGDHVYRVKYRGIDKGVKETLKMKSTSKDQIIIRNLKCNTLYEIKVYREDENGAEYFLDETAEKTKESFAIWVTQMADKIIDEPIAVYQLHHVTERQLDVNKKIKVYEYFSEMGNSEERTILLVGASGSGKSTIINAVVNYLVDVSFTDRFRFRLANQKCRTGSEKETISGNVTCYRIRQQKGSRIEYILNMIEVPEFDGIENENGNYRYIVEQLIDLLNSGEVKFIHAVCLVVKSASRLTYDKKCFFKNILSIFGKNINNIIPLITFDDGNCKNTLDLLTNAGVSFSDKFCFNNSDLHDCSELEQSEVIWNNREDNIKSLLIQLKSLSFRNESTNETLKVLQSRKHLFHNLVHAEKQKQKIEMIKKQIDNYEDCEKIVCKICEENCNDNCSCSIRFYLCLALMLEFFLTFWVCCFGCCLPICSCNDVYCFRVKRIQRLIGCKCSCAVAHHYIENSQKAKLRIKNRFESLEDDFVTTYCNIIDSQDDLKLSALQSELSDEVLTRIDMLKTMITFLDDTFHYQSRDGIKKKTLND